MEYGVSGPCYIASVCNIDSNSKFISWFTYNRRGLESLSFITDGFFIIMRLSFFHLRENRLIYIIFLLLILDKPLIDLFGACFFVFFKNFNFLLLGSALVLLIRHLRKHLSIRIKLYNEIKFLAIIAF